MEIKWLIFISLHIIYQKSIQDYMSNSASPDGIDGIHLKCMQWIPRIINLYVIREAIHDLFIKSMFIHTGIYLIHKADGIWLEH